MSWLNVAIKQDGETFSYTGHGRDVLKAIQTGDFSELEYKGRNDYVQVSDAGLVAIDCDAGNTFSFQTYCDPKEFNLYISREPIYVISSYEEMKNTLIENDFLLNSRF